MVRPYLTSPPRSFHDALVVFARRRGRAAWRLGSTRLVCILIACGGVARAEEPAPVNEVSPPPPELSLKPDPGDGEAMDTLEPEAVTTPAPPPPPPPRREGRSSVAPEPTPPPAPIKKGFVHDGFYLRLALGPAVSSTSLRTDSVSSAEASLNGFGGALDVWLGWTVANGVVIGPSLSGASHQSSNARLGEGKAKLEASRTLLGGFLDAYPNPQKGFHFGGILALANLRLTGPNDAAFQTFSGIGMGLEVFGGYERFIARDWSAGGVLRLGGVFGRRKQPSAESAGTATASEDVTRQATSFSAALLATLVYH